MGKEQRVEDSVARRSFRGEKRYRELVRIGAYENLKAMFGIRNHPKTGIPVFDPDKMYPWETLKSEIERAFHDDCWTWENGIISRFKKGTPERKAVETAYRKIQRDEFKPAMLQGLNYGLCLETLIASVRQLCPLFTCDREYFSTVSIRKLLSDIPEFMKKHRHDFVFTVQSVQVKVIPSKRKKGNHEQELLPLTAWRVTVVTGAGYFELLRETKSSSVLDQQKMLNVIGAQQKDRFDLIGGTQSGIVSHPLTTPAISGFVHQQLKEHPANKTMRRLTFHGKRLLPPAQR